MSTKIERFVIRHVSGSKINQVEEFDFSKPELTIGRVAGSDIQFDPEQEVIVSREHGKIVKISSEPPKFVITDNNSRNGIFVNKSRVKGTVTLSPGDEVQLGNNGPVFSFDIYPRPQDMMMATKIIEIPAAIKPTTISTIEPVELMPTEATKTGLGKQTVERMLVSERKKSYKSMAAFIAGVVVLMGILGYTFLRPAPLPPPPPPPPPPAPDTLLAKKRSPEQIARENRNRVVQIEFGWQLFDVETSDELWHEYTTTKGADGLDHYAAMYIQNAEGGIEPYIDTKRNVGVGVPVGMAGATGTGFIAAQDGYILTNRHVAASWNTRYPFPEYAFPGVLVKVVDGKLQKVPNVQVGPQDVGAWVPAEAKIKGGQSVGDGAIKGRNSYVNVIFAGTTLRRPAVSVTPSETHDVAMIKIDIPGSQTTPVTMKDDYNSVVPGQGVTVMGYPGVAPAQFQVRKSNDPFNNNNKYTTMPTPTVTPGNIGRIVPGSSEKNGTYSTMGDSYQLTINATGGGNSGGPMFDDEGNVIGIYYATMSDGRGTQISFAIPIKYGLELMNVVGK